MELFFHIRHHPPVTMAITPYSPFPSLPSFIIYIYIYILPPDFSCLFIGNRDMAYKRVHPLRRGGECKPWKHAVGSACLTGKDVRNPSNQGEDPRIRSRSRNFVNGNRRYIELSCNLYFHFGFDPSWKSLFYRSRVPLKGIIIYTE